MCKYCVFIYPKENIESVKICKENRVIWYYPCSRVRRLNKNIIVR